MSRYKTFFVQLSKVGFLSILVVLLLVGAVSYSLKNKKAENVYAIGSGEAGSTDVTGEAWSENIGFIRFNGVAKNGRPYGVGIKDDGNIGRLSGHAWSGDFFPSIPDIKGNIGWISFNRSETGNPPASASYDPGFSQSGQPLAYLDTDNKLKGWARAPAACDNNNDGDCVDGGEGSGPGINSGGWDGWIAVGDAKSDAYSYGATLDIATKQFAGYAWGGGGTGATQTDQNNSSVIGWISFNCSNRGVCGSSTAEGGPSNYKVSTNFELNLSPNAPSDLTIEPNANSYCGSGSVSFKWKFTDPNVNSPQNQQSEYKIEASYNAGGPFYVVRKTNQVANNNTVMSVLVPLSEIKSDLGGDWYGKDLYWKVTVLDNGFGNKPSTSTVAAYKLANNEYVLSFNSNPASDKIYAEQDVQFFDLSKVDNPANPGGRNLNIDNVSSICGANCSRSWDFSSNGSPATSALANPITTFAQSMSTAVSLKYTDKDRYGANYSCSSTSQSVNIGLPIPKIEEKK